MEITWTRRQVGETTYGKGAREWAEKRKHEMFEWNDDPKQGDHQIATPWANWTVEQINGGWAVFVEEAE